MFDRITKKTAFYAAGGAIGAAVPEFVMELTPLKTLAAEVSTRKSGADRKKS